MSTPRSNRHRRILSMTVATQTHTLRLSLKIRTPRVGVRYQRATGEGVRPRRSWKLTNALAELECFRSHSALPKSRNCSRRGVLLCPGSCVSVPTDCARRGRAGEIAQAIVAAIRDAGMHAINLGTIPTPALTYYALPVGKGSMMITGSHIHSTATDTKPIAAKASCAKSRKTADRQTGAEEHG